MFSPNNKSLTGWLPDTAASPILQLISLLMGASYLLPSCTKHYFKCTSSCSHGGTLWWLIQDEHDTKAAWVKSEVIISHTRNDQVTSLSLHSYSDLTGGLKADPGFTLGLGHIVNI